MRFLSAFFRVLFGIVLMGMAGFVFTVHQTALSGDQPIQVVLLGQQFSAEPWMLLVGIGASAFFGLILFVVGILKALRKPAVVASENTKP